MFCRTCGNEVNQNAEYCINCGGKPQAGNNHCYNCGVNTNPEQVICISCGVNLEKTNLNTTNNNTKVFCKGCGNQVNENAEICTSCGIRPMQNNKFCQSCGAETTPEQEICTKCGIRVKHSTTETASFATSNNDSSTTVYSEYNEYYTKEFAKFEQSKEEYKGKFNWFAFFLTPIWLISKGLWQLGFIILGLVYLFFDFDVDILNIIIGFLVAKKANYLYYRKEKYGEQLPKNWNIFFKF